MKAEQILQQMSDDEKIRFLSGKNNWQTVDYPEYGIESMFLADGPCGLRKQEEGGDHLGIMDSVPATATVSGGCLAATWSTECALANGKILGEEAAAENVDVLLAPAINIVRSPLCGRNFEYFSEDPHLTGKIAAGYVDGVQQAGVGACLKHFAANNQETEREYIDTIVDERTLREIYLPGFETAVRDANPVSVMSALNQINGVYGAEHHQLLTEILREEWGFDGFTVSDWFGIVHPDRAVAAGMDLDMPYSNGVGARKIREAIDDGRLTWAEVDACCLHLLRAMERVAQLKKLRKPCDKDRMRQQHHEQSRNIAQEGIVLLKNEEHILPLKKDDKIGVIGLYARVPRVTLAGSARVICTQMDIPLDCLERRSGKLAWAQGYTDTDELPAEYRASQKADQSRSDVCDEKALLDEAVALAKTCDKVIFFMGQPSGVEMEGHDRKTIDLPKNQEKVLEAVAAVNKNVVVILANASPVAMPWEKDVKGIFECFMAGQGMGEAVARLLYGEVNPSGKLPVSFTKYLEDTSAYLHFPGNKKEVVYGEGVFVGYRYYDLKRTDLLFPFGYGLSYTNFEYSDMKADRETFAADDETVTVSMTLKNTGKMAGAEVVQLYVGMFDAVVKRPKKELKGFKKVFLQPGETALVTFTLTKRDFAYYDVRFNEWYAPEGCYELLIGASSADIRLREALNVAPKKVHKKPLSGWATIGALRETPLGEKYFQEMKAILAAHCAGDSVFFKKADLETEKINAMRMRFVNLLTNGDLDNDMLLAWIDEVNKER